MGIYNYSARELADEINTLLDNLEGDYQPAELEKALGLVAVEHGYVGASFSHLSNSHHEKGLNEPTKSKSEPSETGR